MHRRFAMVLAGAVLLSPIGACAQGSIDARAQEVIDKTRNTEASYSLFLWTRITPPNGEAREEWAAEFHHGNLHRVETPRDRLIADCEKRTGTYLNVETGEVIEGPQIADAACGVQANSHILSAEYGGKRESTFGSVDLLTVRDTENIRAYQVAENGALVGATIEKTDGTILLKNWATALLDSSRADIYSPASLAESAVPKRYRMRPIE